MGWSHGLLSLTVFSSCALQIIKKLIERKQAQIRKVYPGLSCFKDGVRQIPIESIPGISMYIDLLLKAKSFGNATRRVGNYDQSAVLFKKLFALPFSIWVISSSLRRQPMLSFDIFSLLQIANKPKRA